MGFWQLWIPSCRNLISASSVPRWSSFSFFFFFFCLLGKHEPFGEGWSPYAFRAVDCFLTNFQVIALLGNCWRNGQSRCTHCHWRLVLEPWFIFSDAIGISIWETRAQVPLLCISWISMHGSLILGGLSMHSKHPQLSSRAVHILHKTLSSGLVMLSSSACVTLSVWRVPAVALRNNLRQVRGAPSL